MPILTKTIRDVKQNIFSFSIIKMSVLKLTLETVTIDLRLSTIVTLCTDANIKHLLNASVCNGFVMSPSYFLRGPRSKLISIDQNTQILYDWPQSSPAYKDLNWKSRKYLRIYKRCLLIFTAIEFVVVLWKYR